MNLDYAIAMAYHDGIYLAGAYAAEGEDMSIEGDEVGDSVEEDDYEAPAEDEWHFGGKGQLARVHRASFTDILGTRRTIGC